MRGAAGESLAQWERSMTAEIIPFRAPGSPDPGTPKRFPHKPPANRPPNRKPVPKPATIEPKRDRRLEFLPDQVA
jgi:hypothetical protein